MYFLSLAEQNYSLLPLMGRMVNDADTNIIVRTEAGGKSQQAMVTTAINDGRAQLRIAAAAWSRGVSTPLRAMRAERRKWWISHLDVVCLTVVTLNELQRSSEISLAIRY